MSRLSPKFGFLLLLFFPSSILRLSVEPSNSATILQPCGHFATCFNSSDALLFRRVLSSWGA